MYGDICQCCLVLCDEVSILVVTQNNVGLFHLPTDSLTDFHI